MTVQTTSPAGNPPHENGVALSSQPMSISVSHAGLDALHRWVQSADEAAHLVSRIIDTPFVPESYRPQVDPRATLEQRAKARQVAIGTGTAAVLMGISIGLDPLTALQNIYVVHGKPGLYAKIAVALVQAAGHEIWTEDFSGTRAVVAGRRKGSDVIERVTITMDMARAAGWTKNPAYGKTPADMLWSRAAKRVCDRIASDVLNGIASVEEIEDDRAEAAPQRSVSRARKAVEPPPPSEPPALPVESAGHIEPMPDPYRAAAQDAPPLPGEDTPAPPDPEPAQPASEPPTAAEPAPGDRAEMITTRQLQTIGALISGLGVTHREHRLAIVGQLAELASMPTMKVLTKSQATVVIDRLQRLVDKPEDERRAAVEFMTAKADQPTLDEGDPQ